MYEQLENLRHRDYLYPGMSDSEEEWYLGYNYAIDEIQEIDEDSLSYEKISSYFINLRHSYGMSYESYQNSIGFNEGINDILIAFGSFTD